MEKRLNVRTYSGPSITALAYQPIRREVIVGFEGTKINQSVTAAQFIVSARAKLITMFGVFNFPAPPTYQE